MRRRDRKTKQSPAFNVGDKVRVKHGSTNDQGDRIRMVFGLDSNDPLPDVDDATPVPPSWRRPRRHPRRVA